MGPVLITGICGRLGRALARRLHRETQVVGIDRRPFIGKPKDVVHHELDIRRKRAQDVFRTERPAAVVHLGVMHDPRASSAEHHSWNVSGFSKLLDYVAKYEVSKVVVLSSANVYGPRPDNPQFLEEDAPLLAGSNFSEMRDLVEVDMIAQSFFWKRPHTETVLLRPVHILGAVHNAPSNYLRRDVVPTVMGFDPMVQVIHQADVVEAIRQSLEPSVRGVYNLAGPPPAPVSRVIEVSGRGRLPLPHFAFRAALRRMWRWRATSFPAPELDFIRYVCMVDDARARDELGHSPRHDLEATVRAIDDYG